MLLKVIVYACYGDATIAAVCPLFEEWLKRFHGALTFRLTQVLTGHGCFGSFLFRIVETSAYHHIEDAVGIEMELLQVGSEPVGMRCPFCYEDVMTKANYKNSKITHILALILGIFFWWLCCCIIPYVTRRWKNVEHYCPNCHKYLGMYTRRAMNL